jgi:serine protease AprX
MRLRRGKGKSVLRTGGDGTCGESRSSGLWGSRRGGRGSTDGRNRGTVRRGLLAILLLAFAAPLAASADGYKASHSRTYLAPALSQAAQSRPNQAVSVIVLSEEGAARAQRLLDQYADSTMRLGIVDGAAAQVRAGDLPQLAERPGLAIVPDEPVGLDGLSAKGNGEPKAFKPGKGGAFGRGTRRQQNDSFSSDELWPSAVGVDRLWPRLQSPRRSDHQDGGWRLDTPSIAFVDSGIDASRADFGDRVLAQVDLTSLPGNSPGDGRGHGTFIAGLAAGSAPHHAGAAPTAGIVSIDVMDDQGMARTSDVIAGAQWILRNRHAYDIRVANFSLHSASPSSFRWDPLDKALERLWLAGVVVVTSAGNYANGHQTRIAYGPANDPFVITVGALDLHNSASPERASVPPWSAWGYTYDGFAKPELSAPGRRLLGPVPAGSTLATQRPGQVVQSPEGVYMRLSGTSLSAPIVSGIAADMVALHPNFTPDQVKGALMLTAQPLRRTASFSAGVGEASAPDAAATWTPPNPNRALDGFLVSDPDGGEDPVFDDAAWLEAVKASTTWDAVSWLDGWSNAAWSLVSWSDVSWSDVSWSDVSWSDVSWNDVSWLDVSWGDVYGDID